MTAHVEVDQTATGWRVRVDGADWVEVETDGDRVTVSASPDEPDVQTPLEVTLEA